MNREGKIRRVSFAGTQKTILERGLLIVERLFERTAGKNL